MLTTPNKTPQESLLAWQALVGGKKDGFCWSQRQILSVATLHHPPHPVHSNDIGDQTDDCFFSTTADTEACDNS